MKKFIILLICFTLSLSLTGCHGKRTISAFEMPETFDESKQYTITFWAKNDTNKKQVAIYNQAVEDFEALYPNITVNIRFYTSYDDIYNDVITNIATNTTPNVCITYPDHIATYLTGTNTVACLDDLISDEKYGFGGSEIKYQQGNSGPSSDDQTLLAYTQEGYLNDHYYAIPFMRSTEAIYINKDMVEQLLATDKNLIDKYSDYDWLNETLTWEFVFDVSQAAMDTYDETTGIYGINNQQVMVPFIYKSTDNMMIQMLQQLDPSGNSYSDDEGNIYLLNENTISILENVSIYAASKAFSTFKISSYPGNFLNAGQAIFGIDSTAGATWMGSKAPNQDINESEVTNFETVVKMIPQYDSSNPQMISQGPSICIFNKEDNQEVLASWLFVQYLLSDKVQVSYSQTEGYMPVTDSALTSQDYQDYLANEGQSDLDSDGKETGLYYDIKIEATKILMEASEKDYLFTTAVFNGSASLRSAAGQMIEEVVKGIRRKTTVSVLVDKENCDNFINETYENMVKLYRLNQNGSSVSGKEELGPLPTASKVLIGSLVTVWIVLAIIYLKSLKKQEQ